VSLGERADVEEGEDVLVLVDPVRGDLTRDDLAEDAVRVGLSLLAAFVVVVESSVSVPVSVS